MRILICGCRGQLGRELLRQLEAGSSEIGALPEGYRGADVTAVDMDTLDISDSGAVSEFFRTAKPELILNCAAYTNVDACESHEAEAYRANAEGPANLAAAATEVGAKLLHISTDYVFDGKGKRPYREDDEPCPVSAYGRTKLAGEQAVTKNCKRSFIVRTAWLYGLGGKNFVETMLRLGGEKEEIPVVDDQRGNPTNAEDLAYHILLLAATDAYGVYHCTGRGECSWYEFAKEIISEAGLSARVVPCTSEEYKSTVKRPVYSALSHARLAEAVGDFTRPWREALSDYLGKRMDQ